MRREGETQILVAEMHTELTNPSISVSIEAGARGELMAINSVRYSPPTLQPAVHQLVMYALSSNPEHEANPPASIREFMESKALYAKSKTEYITEVGNLSAEMVTNHIPLYGLLRPRRQIWILYAVNMIPQKKWFGLEINYRPVKVDDVTLSEYNQRYGLYKRT